LEDAVEAHDLFTDHVRARPEALIALPVLSVGRAVAYSGDVVAERVHPNVDHVLGVPGDWNAPLEAATAHAEIAQPALDKRDYFVAARLRTNEIRVLIDVRQ